MITIRIDKRINTELLREELYAAVPAWASMPQALGIRPVEFYLLPDEEGGSDYMAMQIPDNAPMATVEAVLAAHDASRQGRGDRLRAAVYEQAASAVGVLVRDLTAAQVKALLIVLMMKNGAIDPATLRIRPLGEWA